MKYEVIERYAWYFPDTPIEVSIYRTPHIFVDLLCGCFLMLNYGPTTRPLTLFRQKKIDFQKFLWYDVYLR